MNWLAIIGQIYSYTWLSLLLLILWLMLRASMRRNALIETLISAQAIKKPTERESHQ